MQIRIADSNPTVATRNKTAVFGAVERACYQGFLSGQGSRVRAGLPLLVLSAFLATLQPGLVLGQSWIPNDFPLLNWQPTIAPPGARYAGNLACAHCHPAEARSYTAVAPSRASRAAFRATPQR